MSDFGLPGPNFLWQNERYKGYMCFNFVHNLHRAANWYWQAGQASYWAEREFCIDTDTKKLISAQTFKCNSGQTNHLLHMTIHITIPRLQYNDDGIPWKE